ncbi:MAG: carboxymuconolactone decarboxylase family protein [Pseudomonadota bacterium]
MPDHPHSGAPRIPAIPIADAPDEVADILEAWPFNLHRTLAHSPAMMRAWMVFAEKVLSENSLSDRDREIVILRVAWNARSDYEWGMHAFVSRRIGMSEADIAAATRDPDAGHWTAKEAALAKTVDEIMSGWRVSDPTWAVLADHYDHKTLVDLLMLIGEFLLVALVTNATRMDLEPKLDTLPPLTEKG